MELMRAEEVCWGEWQTGDIVWAKITGYPWWPAMVTSEPSHDHESYRVDFFADNSQYLFLHAVPSWLRASWRRTRSIAGRLTPIAICLEDCAKLLWPQTKPSVSFPSVSERWPALHCP